LWDDKPLDHLGGRALVFVGQGPGYQEDLQGRTWQAYAGGLLKKLCEISGASQYGDVFVTNATRCKPPQGSTPTDGNVNKCRPHLEQDLEILQEYYKEIVIVGCGSKAAKSIGKHRSLGGALRRQGLPGVWPGYLCFYMNNPAILYPSRTPAKITAVKDHFMLLMRYLRGEIIPNDLSINVELGARLPDYKPEMVTCDIETYGILAGVSQTVFNPNKSLLIDGVPPERQVVTCSFAWRDPDSELHTALYRMNKQHEIDRVQEWFKFLSENNITAVGQHIKFDLMYLAYCYSALSYWIDPRRLTVDDTMLASFLDYEQRPERGLKELATLLGITDYNKSEVTGKEGNAKGYNDPSLHKYNCLDSAVTLILCEEMWARIKRKYPATSNRFSPLCKWMRNAVIWCTMDLERNGSSLDIEQVKKVHKENEARKKEVVKEAEEEHGLKLCGKDSDQPLRDFFLEAVRETGLMQDDRLVWSPKTGKISIGVENSKLLLKYIGDGPTKRKLDLFQEFKDCAKLTNTYTRPLLYDRRKGIVSLRLGGRVGMVYPSWYSIPSYHSRGSQSDDKAMGQIQGRFSVSRPARQTEPQRIRSCSCSRFEGGTLIEYDMSQDHLRMAALLSNDPGLIQAYTTPGGNLHLETASLIYPDREVRKGTLEYKSGKELNFLVIFRGGPDTFVATVRKRTGADIEREFARQAIDTWYAEHPTFDQWQKDLIDRTAKQGYVETITGWGRTFATGAGGVESSVNEICNCAIQGPCAQCTQSAQYEIMKEFLELGLRSRMCLQIHDSIFVDWYPGDMEVGEPIVKKHLEHPPVLRALEMDLCRSIPFLCERKAYQDETV
jgi:DNA polymerase I-like protein with 3'-5' exonuclease and polymerase domains/uracil-DNA glycosylase